MWYRNPTGPFIVFSVTDLRITRSSGGLTCGGKSLGTIVSDSQGFNIAT